MPLIASSNEKEIAATPYSRNIGGTASNIKGEEILV
jgi:hypothetical protein